MPNRYYGLSSEQVSLNRQKYGDNVIRFRSSENTILKIRRVFHCRLVVTMIVANLLSCCTLLVLEAYAVILPPQIWTIFPILLGLLLLVYLVAILSGRWEKSTHRVVIDPLMSILLMALLFSCLVAFYQNVFLLERSLDAYLEPVGIALAILLSTGVTYWLERKNEKIFCSLNKVNDGLLVKVVREGQVSEIPRKDVVVGDIILLEAGDEVPADAELLDALNLVVNESSLTGESECYKTVNHKDIDVEATFPSNQVFRGTVVLEGEAIAQVFAVGEATNAGETLAAASVANNAITPLQIQLNKLAHLITRISYCVAVLIIVGRIVMCLTGECFVLWDSAGWIAMVKYLIDTLLIAVTLLVVTVPEGLPMAVTMSLAFSMRRLMKQHTLPRTMHSCETMGAVTVICTDKTGTLTQNQMKVADTMFDYINTSQHSEFLLERLWEGIAMNTTANIHIDSKSSLVIGNPTEGALLLWMIDHKVDYLKMRMEASVIERLSFSTERKYMATMVRSVNNRIYLYVKGAPEIVMKYCSLSLDEVNKYTRQLYDYQCSAFRTLALAYCELPNTDSVWSDGHLQISHLNMLGIVAIADPLREDARAAIDDCVQAGISIKIITGDASGTAIEIAKQLGLWADGNDKERLLLGSHIEWMSDEVLKERLKQVIVVSRARPADKERIVRLLQQMGNVVAVTGDGTNDAPALNAADVGLSMGDGSAVAKEASDMTIMDNSFATISNAVMWGRSLYKNIQRFILFQLTINIVACIVVAVGVFVGMNPPLTVTQMLWVNLIMDTLAALALASLPPSQKVMQEAPRNNDTSILQGLKKQIAITGGVMSVVLLVLVYVFQHTEITSLIQESYVWTTSNGISAYESGLFFTIFVMLQFWNLLNSRAFASDKSIFHLISFKTPPCFIGIALLILIGQVLIVELPGLQSMFSVAKGGLLWSDWLLIIALTSLVMWVGEIRRYINRHPQV